jgi:hypothetical protein
MAKQGGGITDKQVDLLKEANRLADAYNLTMAERVSLEEEILNKSIDSKKALEAAAKATEKLYDASEAKLRVDRNRVALEQEIHDLAYDTLQASKDIVKEGANIYTHTRDQAKLQIQDLQTRKSQVEQLIRSNQLTDQQKSALQGTLEHLSQQQAIYDRIVEAHETTADAAANLNTAYGVANDQAEKLASNIDSMFSNMPFGGAFQKIFGLDETSDKLKSGINAGFSEMTNHIAQGGSRMGALSKEWADLLNS